MNYPVSPFTYRGRGEPDPIWLEEDNPEQQVEGMNTLLDAIGESRKVLKELNNKPMAIDGGKDE